MANLILTEEEAKALFETINELSGFNPESVFADDGTDTLEDPVIRAHVKLYLAVGRESLIPDNLQTGAEAERETLQKLPMLQAQAEGYRRIAVLILMGKADRDPIAFLQEVKAITQQAAEKGA